MNVLSYQPTENGFNRNHRKENKIMYVYHGLAVQDGKVNEAIDLRIYGTDSRNYCCVWIMGDKYSSGSDYAGGYGYHRPSAAAEGAIFNAGVKLDKYISGRGDNAIEEAVKAITEYLYPNADIIHVIKSYG
jgi:hypothetical protein